MDRTLLLVIQKGVGRHAGVDRAMIHFSQKGPLWLFFVMAVLAVIGGAGGRIAVLEAVIAAVLTRGVNEVIGRLYVRERPFVRDGLKPLIEHRPSFSFPSNHAACGFALAVAVWLHAPLIGCFMLFLAVLLAFSRLFVAVHYPFDVLAGAVIGSLVAWLTVWIGHL